VSAALLREAASLIQQRAERATPGVWKLWAMSVLSSQDGTSNLDTAIPVADTECDVGGHPRTFNAEHIASWHPAVALAVAELSLAVADVIEAQAAPATYAATRRLLRAEDAFTRAYLGRAS
jgi:hypothetical protein